MPQNNTCWANSEHSPKFKNIHYKFILNYFIYKNKRQKYNTYPQLTFYNIGLKAKMSLLLAQLWLHLIHKLRYNRYLAPNYTLPASILRFISNISVLFNPKKPNLL